MFFHPPLVVPSNTARVRSCPDFQHYYQVRVYTPTHPHTPTHTHAHATLDACFSCVRTIGALTDLGPVCVTLDYFPVRPRFNGGPTWVCLYLSPVPSLFNFGAVGELLPHAAVLVLLDVRPIYVDLQWMRARRARRARPAIRAWVRVQKGGGGG